MKKLILFAVIFLFFCQVIGQNICEDGFFITSFAEGTEVSQPPSISAASAIVIDSTTGRILYEKNAYSRQLPASTTKIMTALLAIESGCSMDEMVEVSERAAATEGSSIYMTPGEKISVEDLLYALMLRSGNDSGVALAEYISGTAEDFAVLMNSRAKELGTKDTNFVTVNGLHDDNHYTTAYDMSLIAREAMKNDLFRKIVSTKNWSASRDVDKFNYFYNKNKVIHQYEGGNGIKIGYTTAAGRCLVASSERDGMELICVVFAAPDWFNDSYKLMDYIYNTYEAQTLIKADTPVAMIGVENGDKDHSWIMCDHDIVFPKKKGEDVNVSFEVLTKKTVPAPVVRGNIAGDIVIYYNSQEVGRDSVVFREDISTDTESENNGVLNKFFELIKGGL